MVSFIGCSITCLPVSQDMLAMKVVLCTYITPSFDVCILSSVDFAYGGKIFLHKNKNACDQAAPAKHGA